MVCGKNPKIKFLLFGYKNEFIKIFKQFIEYCNYDTNSIKYQTTWHYSYRFKSKEVVIKQISDDAGKLILM